MIGRIRTPQFTLTLDDDYTWACDPPRPALLRALPLMLPDHCTGPASGPRGVAALRHLAEQLGGELELGEARPGDADPGRIY